jgi:hypothetical protein
MGQSAQVFDLTVRCSPKTLKLNAGQPQNYDNDNRATATRKWHDRVAQKEDGRAAPGFVSLCLQRLSCP